MRLTLPMPPSANRYWVTFAYISRNGRNPGKPMANTVPSTHAKEYKQAVADLCRKQKIRRISGEIFLTVRVYRSIRRGDLDNRLKVLIDALKGVAFDDDEQIVRIHAYRHDDKSNPRVEVEIEEAPEVQANLSQEKVEAV